MERYFIIGYMGCGKTHFGRKLAQQLNLKHIDLDHFIESRYCKAVAQIFEKYGEDGFRKRENACLKEIADYEDVVISTGGGTPCYYDNLNYMKGKGKILFINMPVDILCKRLLNAKNVRPLILGKTEEELKDYIIESLKVRLPYYLQADTIIESTQDYLLSLIE